MNIYIVFLRGAGKNLCQTKAIAEQGQTQLKGIGITALSHGKCQVRVAFPEVFYRFESPVIVLLVLNLCSQGSREQLVLAADPVDLVKPAQLYIGQVQSLSQILCSITGLRMKDQVKVGLGHILVFLVIPAAADLPDLPDTHLSEKVIDLAILCQGGKITQEIDRPAVFLPFFQKGIEGLSDMDHGRLSSLPGKGIHIAGQDRQADPLRCLFTHSFHIGPQKGIHAGDTNHDH